MHTRVYANICMCVCVIYVAYAIFHPSKYEGPLYPKAKLRPIVKGFTCTIKKALI